MSQRRLDRLAVKRQPISLKAQALALLAQREHSVAELRRKLLRHRAKISAASAGAPGLLDPARGATFSADAASPHDAPADEESAASEVEALIDWLRANRYLSEERFVESRIHARSSRYGNLRIRQELAQHGVVLSAESTQQLKDSEHERALEVWRRKFGTPAADPAERAKQSRFLAQRGFSPGVISRVLRHRED